MAMRLYSRGQVVLFSILSCLLTAFIITGAGKLAKRTAPKNGKVQETSVDEPPAGGIAADLELAAELPENQPRTIEVQAAASYTEDERENISVYERLNSAVVNITTETMAINWFLEPVPQEGGSGSGSIIDTRGYVLTNNHVIQNAYKVYINLADGSQYEGTVAGSDPENDLAVVKFDPPAGTVLKTVPYGDSGGLKVGQKVLAIGNPFALERTLTVGIVSGLGRPVQITRQHIVRDMIQTDASINPGNSGGPLLDSHGRMIGINTMIYSPSGGSVGIGFAVPVNTAKRVVNELIQYGKVRRGWFDATMVQLFPALVRYAKFPVSSGLLVSRTRRGGLADKAGLKQGSEPVQYGRSVIYLGGDIITSVDDVKIAALSDLYSALEHSKPGDKVKVGIMRGSTALTIEIPLADREEVMNN
jgi:S1-C subfamily serine protease